MEKRIQLKKIGIISRFFESIDIYIGLSKLHLLATSTKMVFSKHFIKKNSLFQKNSLFNHNLFKLTGGDITNKKKVKSIDDID